MGSLTRPLATSTTATTSTATPTPLKPRGRASGGAPTRRRRRTRRRGIRTIHRPSRTRRQRRTSAAWRKGGYCCRRRGDHSTQHDAAPVPAATAVSTKLLRSSGVMVEVAGLLGGCPTRVRKLTAVVRHRLGIQRSRRHSALNPAGSGDEASRSSRRLCGGRG